MRAGDDRVVLDADLLVTARLRQSEPRVSGGSLGSCAMASSDSTPFDLTLDRVEGIPVVAVLGDLDIVSAPTLTARLQELSEPVVFDLRHCGFMDSSGFGAIVTYQREQPIAVLQAPDGGVRRTLALMLGDSPLVYDSMAAAVTALSR